MLSYSADLTYGLADLREWNFQGTSLAVLGQPVRHSISPQMHNSALERLSLANPEFSNWRYFRFEIEPEQLLESLPLFHQKGFKGLNLTVPHKEIAFPAAKPIDPPAIAIGAINTLVHHESGYAGYNTDGYGLSQGIKIQLGRELAGADIVLLGAGGAARAAAIQALRSPCKSLTIVNRNQDRLARLLSELQPIADSAQIQLTGVPPASLVRLPANCLLLNATSVGLKQGDSLPIPEGCLAANIDCFDMIYNPPTTKLMRTLASLGGRCCNGLSMLVHQGAKSLEIWTGTPAPARVMQEAAENALPHNP